MSFFWIGLLDLVIHVCLKNKTYVRNYFGCREAVVRAIAILIEDELSQKILF